jgi:hypothetical protein
MKQQPLFAWTLISYFDHDVLTTVGAGCLDPTIHVERSADSECVPRTIRVPPAVLGEHAVGSGHGRERIRHPDGALACVQHERVRLVKSSPAGLYRLWSGTCRLRDLIRRGASSEFDEQAIGQVPEVEVSLIHSLMIPRRDPLTSDHAMRSVDRTWRSGMSRPNEGPRVTDRSSDEGRVPSPDAHVPPPPPAIDLTTPLKPDRLVPWIPLAALGLAILASVTWVLVSSDPSTIHFPDTIEERQRMHSPAFQDLAEGLTMAVPVDSLRPAVAVYGTGEQPSFMVLAYVDSPTVEEYETFWENMSGRLKGSGQGSLKVDSLTRAVYGSTTYECAPYIIGSLGTGSLCAWNDGRTLGLVEAFDPSLPTGLLLTREVREAVTG